MQFIFESRDEADFFAALNLLGLQFGLALFTKTEAAMELLSSLGKDYELTVARCLASLAEKTASEMASLPESESGNAAMKIKDNILDIGTKLQQALTEYDESRGREKLQ